MRINLSQITEQIIENYFLIEPETGQLGYMELYHHDKEDAESLKIDLEVTPFAITVTWLKDGESINIINDHVFHTKNKAVIRVRQLLKGKGLLNRLRRRSFFSEVKVFHALHCINEWGWACQLNENPFPFNRFGYVVLIPKIRAYRLRLIPDTISIFDVFFSESFELGKIPGSVMFLGQRFLVGD